MPATDFRTGLQCKTYYNSATYASPTWVEIVNIRDEDLDMTIGEADMSRRASDWEEIVVTLKKGTFNFDVVYKYGDAVFTVLLNAFLNRTAVEFAFADGAIATSGTLYLRATCYVGGVKQNRKLTEGVTYPFTLRVAASDNAPSKTLVP